MQVLLTAGEAEPVTLTSGQRIVIGRGLDAGLRLEGEGISRSHAALALISERLYLTDLDSRHGTFLNEARLPPGRAVLVLPGAKIGIGPFAISVEAIPDPDQRAWADEQLARVVRIVPPEKYDVLGKLGGGSLGTVWAARRLADDQLVAIKVLRLELEPDSEAHQRFLREARLLEQLDSPYVVQFLGSGCELGKPYLVTELVHGPSLKDRLEEDGRLPIPEAMRIAEDIARALHDLSKLNIIHRDVKPQNVLLYPGGAAMLTDFGVAKSLDGGDEPLTEKGFGLGTLAYLAPEQATDAANVDARADLYGLGATLYHLIGGRAPLLNEDSDTSLDVVKSLQAPLTPLRKICPDCPQPLAEFVEALLATNPNERLHPADNVAAQLKSLRQALYPDSHRRLDETPTRAWGSPRAPEQ